MHLFPGQSLLHFRLLEPIGEGGMGQVWRALDTTLDREVAIKVLPEAFAADPERVARFEREAKLLASLNHANIAAIYGFPEAVPAVAGGDKVRFLAMELVRGENLAEILARGALPIREALDAARQIASALEAAHDSGVVHRDLKPANVQRTPEGQFKVLDFGLAKALDPREPTSTHTATVTSAGTVAGMILGTASYMSPEQARGLPVDRRTDLWAFGCLLFEMLSGAKAFDGPTITDVLAAVVQGEPDWEKLPAGTPVPARRLLRRCLEKDPRRRLRDAGDASLLLEDNPEDARRPAPGRPVRRWILPVAVLAAALAGGLAGWGLGRRAASPLAPVSFERLTYARGMMRAARFAPDGQTVVYGAAWNGPPIRLYLARADAPDGTAIALPPSELLSISRTGEMAVSLGHAYSGWMGHGTLARTPLLGGSPREILEGVRAADWSPDGSEFAIVRRVDGNDQLEYPVGTVLHKTAGYIADVRVSPDGARVAFTDHPVYADDRGDLAVVDRAGSKTTLQADYASIRGVAWSPGGAEVWFTGSRDGRSVVLSAADLAGRARTVHASIADIELFDIAADGRVLLGEHDSQRQAQALLAGYSEPRPLIIPGESSMARAIAPDGRSALVASHLSKEYETYVVRADRSGAVRLSVGDAGTVSPDGAWALSITADAASMLLSPLGAGTTTTVPNPEGVRYEGLPAWLPGGRQVVVTGRRGGEPSHAFVCDLTTGALTAFASPGVFWSRFGSPPVSPDGRFVVLEDAAGIPRRYPIAGGEPLAIPGLLPDDDPLAWTEDGAALFVGGSAIPIPISRLDLATGERRPWMTIDPADSAGLRIAAASITPNGKYWTLSTSKLLTNLYVVEGLR